MVTCPMTLTDPNPNFEVTAFLNSNISKTVSQGQSCYRTLVGYHRWRIDPCVRSVGSNDLEWPWKVGWEESIFFFRRILITLVRSTTSLHLPKCIARFVSDSWVSCYSLLWTSQSETKFMYVIYFIFWKIVGLTSAGLTSTTPGGSHMTASLGGRYDPSPVKRSSEWVSEYVMSKLFLYWRDCHIVCLLPDCDFRDHSITLSVL